METFQLFEDARLNDDAIVAGGGAGSANTATGDGVQTVQCSICGTNMSHTDVVAAQRDHLLKICEKESD